MSYSIADEKKPIFQCKMNKTCYRLQIKPKTPLANI